MLWAWAHTHTLLMILHWAYEHSYLSLLFPLLHRQWRRFLVSNYLRCPPPSLPAPACHTEKASLSCYTATTMWCLRGTLACVRQPRVPTERLPWMCLSLKSSLISCQEDKRKVEVALSPPHHLLHIPSDVCFMVLPSSFVVAFTCK